MANYKERYHRNTQNLSYTYDTSILQIFDTFSAPLYDTLQIQKKLDNI